MSKRYGRNQKRKAAVREVALKKQIDICEGKLKIKTESEYKAAIIIDIARDINPNAPMFGGREIEGHIWKTVVMPRLEAVGSLVDLDSLDREVAIKTIDLVEIEIVLRKDDAFCEYLQFDVSARDQYRGRIASSAYRISMAEFLRESNFEQLQSHISRILSAHFRDAISELKRPACNPY